MVVVGGQLHDPAVLPPGMLGGSQSSELWRKQKSLAPTGNVQFLSCTNNSPVATSTVLSWFKLAQVCFKLNLTQKSF